CVRDAFGAGFDSW
nr:immunoglobulin heavy chain junction region [Macaca mulatta]MOW75781.1 immunoglobulin heavy chain junction region [Macaca mulatta]MOW78136.1 immunoglobulin heavy chain junction region [Macaca mulatta]MOW78205.1 immunoglobulin heavy chain junction region [Macaca mulatta]MOW80352.1 immunoglobulin heavy chain junction region [Macaca mulatta]